MKHCFYCGADSDSVDHIPPRCFLEKPYPTKMYTVPACTGCNQGFSKDEEYTASLLAIIGTNPQLIAKAEEGGKVDRAFSRSPAFEQRFIDRLKVDEGGRVYVEPESERITRVLLKIVAGLFWVRYRRIARPSVLGPIGFWPYNIQDDRPAQAVLPAITERFKPKRWTIVQENIFEFMFARLADNKLCCIINWHMTLWITCIVPHPHSRHINTGQRELSFD